jgi:HUS1 checkpoint protein
VIQAVEKLQKRIVLHFSESALKIICAGASSTASSSSGGVQVWSDIAISSLFSAYRIQSNANNEITMAMSPESLLATLRSAEGTDAEEVTMKLAKKNDWAVLSFEISGSSKVGRRMRVTHDVRIEVLKPTDAEKLKEPQCPEPDVRLCYHRNHDIHI